MAALSLATPAIAKTHVIQTRNRAAVVTNTGNHHRNHWRDSRVFWNVGVGIGVPFYGGYYGGYPSYGGYQHGYYPYGYGSYPYGGSYYSSAYPYHYNRTVYRGYNGSLVARVQERLARAGYYAGPIDGGMGPRTRYAIRVYEGRHGLPVDGIIDRRLLATMGLA